MKPRHNTTTKKSAQKAKAKQRWINGLSFSPKKTQYFHVINRKRDHVSRQNHKVVKLKRTFTRAIKTLRVEGQTMLWGSLVKPTEP